MSESLKWILVIVGGLAALILAGVIAFALMLREQPILGLGAGGEPLRGSLISVSSSANASGSCSLRVYRLSEDSAARLRRRGGAALGRPGDVAGIEGASGGAWRQGPIARLETAPWNWANCDSTNARDLISLLSSPGAHYAVLRGEDAAAVLAASGAAERFFSASFSYPRGAEGNLGSAR